LGEFFEAYVTNERLLFAI